MIFPSPTTQTIGNREKDLAVTRDSRQRCAPVRGFTLVELLVVLMLLLMLAAVGLPAVKELIKDQKTAQTARNIVAYVEGARSRAIASGQPVGVLFERFGIGDFASRSYSTRLRMLTAVPPYSGESANSVAYLFHYDPDNPGVRDGIINAALFEASDNPLLSLSAQQSGTAGAPIRIGARFEVQDGRSVRINSIEIAQDPEPRLPSEPASGARTAIRIRFDPREVLPYRPNMTQSSHGHPSRILSVTSSEGSPPGTRQVPFRIHRLPTPSNVDSLELPRGMAVDLSYSGIGPDGTHFAASTIDSSLSTTSSAANFQPVTVMFAPDGSVEFCAWGLMNLDERPAGNLFFLLGKTDQVPLAPDTAEWFRNTGREQANLMDLESAWLTINPNNGNVFASPVASFSPGSTLATLPPSASPLNAAVLQSRQFALQSDTLSSN